MNDRRPAGRTEIAARLALVAVVALTVVVPTGRIEATETTLAPCSAPEFPNPQQYTYDSANDLMITAYVPEASAPRPAIIVVEGADFNGVPPLEANTGSTLDCAARFLAAQGYAVFAPGYRGIPFMGGSWPALPFTDVQNAVRWLRDPVQLSQFALDPGAFGGLGTSAAGLIVGLLGTSTDPMARLQAVVSWSGPMDLTAEPIVPPSGLDPPNVLTEIDEVIPLLIGCDPYTPDTVNDTWTPVPSCLEGAAAAASPARQVGPGTAPMYLANAAWEGALVGMGDCTATGSWTPPSEGCFGIPSSQATAMGAALSTAGIPNALDVVSVPTLVGPPCNAIEQPVDTIHVEYAACAQSVWDGSRAWFQTYLAAGAPPAPAPAPASPASPASAAVPVAARPTFTG